jgi:hypothetical protein
MKYNRTRDLELLKRESHFKDLKKSFSEEEPENSLEFLADISDYFYWKNRFKLFSMMEKFLNGSIDKKEFSDNISELRREVAARSAKLVSELNSGKLQDLNPDLRLKGSASFLYILCDNYDDYDQDENDSDKQKFYQQVKKCFLKFKEDLDSDEEKDKF